MKKLIALILVLAFCKQIHAQQSVNQSLNPSSMISLDYFNTYNLYSSNPNGNKRIGQCLPDGTSTQNGPIFNYVLIIFDLEQQLGGMPNSLSNSNVTVQLDGSFGWNGQKWQAGFITTDVSSSSAQIQVNAIRNMSYSEATDKPTSQLPTITLELTLSKIVNNKIIIGVRRDNAGIRVLSSCSVTINGSILRKSAINVAYNQGTGNIVAYSGSYKTHPSPAQVNAYETNQITIATLSPTIQNYQLVYNESMAPSNKSCWKKMNSNGIEIAQLIPASNSFPILKSEDNWTYEAQMKKLCIITLSNPGHNIYLNGNTHNSSLTTSVVEQNSITAYGNTYVNNGIEYRFTNWSKGGSTFGQTITPSEHGTYSANYDNGRPVFVNFYFGSIV
ncbi:MAG: hypothetical protein FD143_2653, partial [Ignavibacteria bacterium]